VENIWLGTQFSKLHLVFVWKWFWLLACNVSFKCFRPSKRSGSDPFTHV
jgi:hypothetical protein